MYEEMKQVPCKVLGALGEDMAVQLLIEQGFRIWARNYRCRTGEIDIIASKNRELRFIEVKTRRNFNYGRPCEAITPSKKRHIRMSAEFYLKKLEESGYIPDRIEFDVMEIVIQHTECAF